MPILTLSLTANTNVITLDHDIDAQHLRLKMYEVSFPDGNYSDTAIWLDIEGSSHFLSHDCMNGVAGSIPQGKFLLPCKNETGHRAELYYPDIAIGGSTHIPKVFTVKLYEADGTTLITDAHLDSVRLIFEYDNHSRDGQL